MADKIFFKSDDGNFNRGMSLEVKSVGWGTNSLSTGSYGSGQSQGAGPGRPRPGVQDVHLTMPFGNYAAEFARAAVSGKLSNFTVSYSKPINRGYSPYMQYTVKQAVVSHYNENDNVGPGGRSISVSFKFQSVVMN